MKLKMIVVFVVSLIVAGQALAQLQWRSYENPRFGYSISYPASLFSAVNNPANTAGVVFKSEDGKAHITVSASINSQNQTPKDYVKWVTRESGLIDLVTYSKSTKNWAVISGFKGNMVYYEKTIFSCNNRILNWVTLLYPVSEKSLYDRLVGKVTKSLEPGRGSDTPQNC